MYWKLFLLTICVCLTSCEIVVEPREGDLDWWQNSVIYEIFIQSFKDSNGDGFGDFKGVTEKLDYLVDIGVTAIWLTPFLESPLKSGGYDVSDYLNVQDVYGSMDDFKILVKTAHKKNISVIMDFVPNHTSNEHEWFKNSKINGSKYENYYIWKDAKNQNEVMANISVIPIVPNNWTRICNDGKDITAWYWDNTRKQFYYSTFIANLPDLNYRNQNVHREMKHILNFWMDLGIDGIRIDAARHIYENENMKDEPVIDSEKPLVFDNFDHLYTIDQDEVYDLLTEWHLILDEFKKIDGKTRIMLTESNSPLSVLYNYYTSGAQVPINFNLMNYLTRMTPKDYDTKIREWINYMPTRSTFNAVFQSHDSPRFFIPELIDGMNALSLFLPGVAIVYYGGEIGMDDIEDKLSFSRGLMQWDDTQYAGFTNNRTHEPWIQIHPDYVTKNVHTETEDPKSHLNLFKSVSKLRQTETLKRGGLATYIFNDTVYILNRFLPGNENFTLVINMGSNIQFLRLSDQMSNLYGSLNVVVGSKNSDFDPGNTIVPNSQLKLSPGAMVIFTDKTNAHSTMSDTWTTTEATKTSSGVRSYIAFKILLVCLCLNILFNLQ